jgi:hypothetical protein
MKTHRYRAPALSLAPFAVLGFALAGCSPQDDPAAQASDVPTQATPAAAEPTSSPTPAPTAPTTAATIPAAFHGTWDNASADCEPATDARLTIAGDRLRFYESEGKVTRVEVDSPTRIVVSADLSGEGESWTNSYLFELRDDGKTLSSNSVDETASTPLLRKRCD